jgi:uncharacterized protein YxjI
MNYPLEIKFKLLALAQQLSITDAQGSLVFYVKQKAFKLREAITVFGDQEQTRPLYKIDAEKILDFSGRYNFTDEEGRHLGSVKRQGMRSIWKAHYDIYDGAQVVLTIREENAWIKVFDSLFGELPIVGMFSGYLFHPAYIVSRPNGSAVLRMAKQAAFFEGRFHVEKLGVIGEDEELRATLGLIMMILLERSRG